MDGGGRRRERRRIVRQTGSRWHRCEDYYGYSFGSGTHFTSPFVTQPIATGQRNNPRGLTVNGRIRGLDTIPFRKSFKFDLEVWKWR